MLSAVILSTFSYSAFSIGIKTDTPWMCLFWSSRTKKSPLNTPTLTPDMDRTVSRRSEPSSRTALAGEQPDPWNVLPLQVAMSRHRGAKPPRRYELSEKISLLAKVMIILYIYI